MENAAAKPCIRGLRVTVYDVLDNLAADTTTKTDSVINHMADLVAYLVYLCGMRELKIGEFPNRLKSYLSDQQLKDWLDLLKPSLNLKAAADNPYGIKIHPKIKRVA